MQKELGLGGEISPPLHGAAARPTVRHFRQIVVWPLQLERAGSTRASAAELLQSLGTSSWQLVDDEFGTVPLEERHYREFVSFLPQVQRFVYGDAPGPVDKLGPSDAPMRIWRRKDVAGVRVVPVDGAAPVTCRVVHVDLHVFNDVDVIILACEIETSGIPLELAQTLMYRFGRAYPPGWSKEGEPLHCPERVEWLDANGSVLARSDYENRDRYLAHVGKTRSPCFSSHWEYILSPLVAHASAEKGPLRFRQVEYYRMPQAVFLSFDSLQGFERSDYVRLAFASSPGEGSSVPYSEKFLADFEQAHCYDRFFHDHTADSGMKTRFLLCGHAMTVISEGDQADVEDNERGLLGQFRHQYFLLFLICHFHKAALLMLSDRLVAATKLLEVRSQRSAIQFRREIYRLQEAFMRFTQRYWFTDVSDQVQAHDLFRKQRTQLVNEELYRDLRSELFDTVQYLDSDILRRQTGSMHRLTAVTIVGLIGTVATGFLGMNLIAAADEPMDTKIWMFGGVMLLVAVLTVLVVLASRSLTALFDWMSGDR